MEHCVFTDSCTRSTSVQMEHVHHLGQTVLIGLGCHSAQDPSANLLHLAEILNGYNSSPVLLFITWQHMPNNSAELLITYQLIRF